MGEGRIRDYNVKNEFLIENKINSKCIEKGFLARRNLNKYDIDILIYNYNFDNMQKRILCGVEIEVKNEKYQFVDGKPPESWPVFSFLSRKIHNQKNKDNDIYIISDTNFNIFWTTFKYIRRVNYSVGDGDDAFHQMPIDGQIYYGYEKLLDYFLWLTNKKKSI